jgi:ketosteroid isomerase-like protein
VIDELRRAVDALNAGDSEPFAALIADDSEWRGRTRGHLWWKRTPVCHGPDEAREVMRHSLAKRAEGRAEIEQPEFTWVGDDTLIGSAARVGSDGRRQVRYQVLRVREGKIVDMQGCGSRREAERVARLPAGSTR